MTKLDINDHLVVVANLGRFQWLCILLSGMVITQYGLQTLTVIFTHFTPNFRCVDTEVFVDNSTINRAATAGVINMFYDNSCGYLEYFGNQSFSRKCLKFEFDFTVFISTVVTQFDLVCDREHYMTILNVAWVLSVGVGSIFGSFISDRFGRKTMIICSYLVTSFFGTIAAYSTNFIMYVAMRLCVAFVCFAGMTASLTLVAESISPHKKSHGLNLLGLFWVLGLITLALWGYLLRDWRHLQLTISIIGFPFGIASFWLLDESPHWLLLNKKQEKAFEVLNRMAEMNKVVAPNLEFEKNGLFMVDGRLQEDSEVTDNPTSAAKETCCDMWKYKRVVIRFIIFSAGWLGCAFCYYALLFRVSRLPGNIYIHIFTMSIVEALACGCCFVVAVAGRKWPTVLSFLTLGCASLISTIVQIHYSAAWQIIWIWGVEVYPTSHRCMLTNISGVVGRVGSILALYIVDLPRDIQQQNEGVILYILFVILMISVGLLHILLPETNNRKLPKTLWEGNQSCFPIAKDDVTDDTLVNGGLLARLTQET